MHEPIAPTTFDSLIAARTDVNAIFTLRDLASAAVTDGKGVLNVWTLITDGRAPLKLVARSAGLGIEVRTFGWAEVLLVEDVRGPFNLVALPTGSEGVFILVGSVAWTDPRWERVRRWVANAAPLVVACYLNEADFDAIGQDLGRTLGPGGRVEVSRVAARYLRDQSPWNRSWSALRQHRPTYNEVLSELAGVAAVHTLTLHVGDTLNLLLRKGGAATYYSGSFDLFDRIVVHHLVAAAGRRRTLLVNRARATGKPTSAPIVIRLPGLGLCDADAIADLIDIMATPRGIGVAVLHRNPYLHVAVTDYLDGSNFDAFVTSPNEISIHPGFTASLGALSRFTQFLGEQLVADEIAEAEPQPLVSLEELLTTG